MLSFQVTSTTCHGRERNAAFLAIRLRHSLWPHLSSLWFLVGTWVLAMEVSSRSVAPQVIVSGKMSKRHVYDEKLWCHQQSLQDFLRFMVSGISLAFFVVANRSTESMTVVLAALLYVMYYQGTNCEESVTHKHPLPSPGLYTGRCVYGFFLFFFLFFSLPSYGFNLSSHFFYLADYLQL